MEQTHRVKILEPLAIADVGFSARNIFGVAGIDQADLKPVGFQDLKKRDPVNAGGLHGDGAHPASLEPIANPQQVVRESGEGANGIFVGIDGNGDLDVPGTDVDARRVRVKGRELGVGFDFCSTTKAHNFSFVKVSDGRAAPGVLEQMSSLLIGMNDRRANVGVLTSDLHGGLGTTLTSGLF